MKMNAKPIKAFEEEIDDGRSRGPALVRTLSAMQIMLLGIGVIIGAGIFSVTGVVAAAHAGPAITFSFVLASVACALAALCYSEFSTLLPISGSAYSYTYATLGEFAAWAIGWDLLLEYAAGGATIAISFSAYFLKAMEQIGVAFPVQWAASPWSEVILANGTRSHGLANLPAAFIIVVSSILLIRGTKVSATVNAVLVVIKLVVLVGFVIVGWGYIDHANLTPYIPQNSGTWGQFGWSGVLSASGLVFFAYIGFDALSTTAQEAKNPQRAMPIGILGALGICTILYLLFSHVLLGLTHYTEFAGVEGLAPVAKALESTPYRGFSKLVVVAILAGFSSVIMVLLMSQSRIFYAMAKDGMLPSWLAEVHPRWHTPWKSNILFCVMLSLVSAFVPGKIVAELTSIGTLAAFVLVCLAVPLLRRSIPNLPRPFKVPLNPVLPFFGAAVCLGLMVMLPWQTWLRFLGWLAVGAVIYLAAIKNGRRPWHTK
jgi:APA family basic amino acid/polyamine antiporter